MRQIMQTSMWILAFYLMAQCSGLENKNVLLIFANGFGHEAGYPEGIITPRLDELALQSYVFDHNFIQDSNINISRTSMLTGMRPTSLNIEKENDFYKYRAPNGQSINSMPKFFKDVLGYDVYATGQICSYEREIDQAVSTIDGQIKCEDSLTSNIRWEGRTHSFAGISNELLAVANLPDQVVKNQTKQWIAEAAGRPNNNFFIMTQFRRPFLPFIVPQEYLDMYPDVDQIVPPNFQWPLDAPKQAFNDMEELLEFDDARAAGVTGDTTDEIEGAQGPKRDFFKNINRAHVAAITYTDALFGEIWDELIAQGLDSSTIVVFAGLNGIHTMHNGMIGSNSLFDKGLRVPFLFRDVSGTPPHPKLEGLTELVDLFPTLVSAAARVNLEACSRTNQPQNCTDGNDVLIGGVAKSTKNFVFSQNKKDEDLIAYSVRSAELHYIVRVDSNYEIETEELYDVVADPLETKNRAVHTDASGEPIYDAQMRELRREIVRQLGVSLIKKD